LRPKRGRQQLTGNAYGDGLSRIVNTYDALGRLTSETTITNQPGIVVPGSKYSYTYEGFTPLTRTIATAPAGQSTGFTDVAISTYTLDDLGRTVGVNQIFNGSTTNWKSGQLPDSIIATATFNLDGQVGQVIRRNMANAPMFQSDYQYSLKGELEKVTHTGAGGSTIGRGVASHEILRTQDGRAQTASATVSGNNGQTLATASGQYNYDSYGNPSSVTPAAGNEDLNLIPGFKPQTNTGQTEGSHSRSAQNRQLGNSDHLYRYDNEGRLVYERQLGELNVTQDSSTQQIFETDYVYDLAGRLRTRTDKELSKSTTVAAVTTTVVSLATTYFAYDAAGRLLEESQIVGTLRTASGYIGGGNSPDLIYELDGASALISTAQTVLPGVAGTIAVSGNAGSMETLWTLPDTAGSTRTYAALNETGNSVLIRHQHFDGQGVVTTTHTDGTLPAGTSLPIQFAGNLYHALTRDYVTSDGGWYDPDTGNRLTSTANHLGSDSFALATAYPSTRVGAVAERQLTSAEDEALYGQSEYFHPLWIKLGVGTWRTIFTDEYLSQATDGELQTIGVAAPIAGFAASWYAVAALGLTGVSALAVGGAVDGAAVYGSAHASAFVSESIGETRTASGFSVGGLAESTAWGAGGSVVIGGAAGAVGRHIIAPAWRGASSAVRNAVSRFDVAPVSGVEGAIGFAPGYAQGIANKGLRKSFRKAMDSVGAKVKFVNEGDSYFNPRTMTAVINKTTATPGTLLDEFTHAFSRMHGKGRYLSDELAEVHKALANRVKVLGSTDRLGLADNTLYHQLELLNFMNSGVKRPGFIRVIPQNEISRFLSPLELNGPIGGIGR
jgi:hypothetical protein